MYEAGSSSGTTTSVSDTFKQSYSIAVETSGGRFGNGGGGGLSFTYSRSETSDQSLEIKKSRNTKLMVPGPSVDGIDHDRDLIYVWLNPQINLALTSTSAAWTFAGTGTAVIKRLYAGCLKTPSCTQDAKHPTCIPQNERDDLKQYGITEQDFPDILQRDVLATGVAPDPKRFKPLNFTFGYEPPFSPTDPVPTTTYT